MIRTQIQLTEEQASSLKKLAALHGVSMAELIRDGVERVLRSDTAVMVGEDQKKRALAVAGRFRSGKRDLSAKHDAYLAEAFRK